MERGQRVKVRAYPNKLLPRVVWQEYRTYIEVCREEVYLEAVREGRDPEATMGIPKGDVLLFEKEAGEAE